MFLFSELSYLGLFLSSFLAATFLPFSSEVVISLMQKNQYNLVLIVLIATIGNTLGGMFTFWIGFRGKLSWAQKFLRIDPKSINKFQKMIQKYGALIAFFCWLPIFGDPLALVLGYFKVNGRLVSCYMVIGKLLRYIALVSIIDKIRLDQLL